MGCGVLATRSKDCPERRLNCRLVRVGGGKRGRPGCSAGSMVAVVEESGSHWRSILVRVWCLLLYVCGPREERESRVNITQIIEEYTPPPPPVFLHDYGFKF